MLLVSVSCTSDTKHSTSPLSSCFLCSTKPGWLNCKLWRTAGKTSTCRNRAKASLPFFYSQIPCSAACILTCTMKNTKTNKLWKEMKLCQSEGAMTSSKWRLKRQKKKSLFYCVILILLLCYDLCNSHVAFL